MSAPDTNELFARLEALETEAAIRARILDIARGLDRYDANLVSASVWPDATLDFGGDAPVPGQRFAANIKPPADPRPGRMHVVGNIRIAAQGDVAHSESYIVSIQDVADGEGTSTRVRAGRWVDRFERRAGEWRLAARILVDEWGRTDPVQARPPQGRHLGRPAPEDVSYQA